MIGLIADDVTGATDAAVAFRRQGLRVGIYFGLPNPGDIENDLDAAVIALKSRTIPSSDAVRQTIAAAEALRAAGARQLYFKYCSTFDSTPTGNIGPVLDALAELTGTQLVVSTPSSPEHGRTTYNGYLYVYQQLLSESHMSSHPLTPMKDSSLTRLMDAQTEEGSSILTHETIQRGSIAIKERLDDVRGITRYLFPDAISDDDLYAVAQHVLDEPLVAGAAGLAGAIARAHAKRSGKSNCPQPQQEPTGPAIVLAGSCSKRTLEQIEQMHRAGTHAFHLDALATQDPEALSQEALSWFDSLAPGPAPLIYSSLPPAEHHKVQEILGVDRSAEILETAMGLVAQGLEYRGITRYIVAGGETSGSVVNALGIGGGVIGPEAARSVPWIHTDGGFDILLKSGNFGDPELLLKASAKGPRS
ncbi:3-oxo-tetronate kinase [Paenarthrobacter sp. RAF54_2]|uniref:3-oxo-tetronate kinase n=1 Tax=Paenarthrobacter sp. RAF54_2 TaxID=3233061 RepID=UPI003F97A3D6